AVLPGLCVGALRLPSANVEQTGGVAAWLGSWNSLQLGFWWWSFATLRFASGRHLEAAPNLEMAPPARRHWNISRYEAICPSASCRTRRFFEEVLRFFRSRLAGASGPCRSAKGSDRLASPPDSESGFLPRAGRWCT